jgi:hypothetical protein
MRTPLAESVDLISAITSTVSSMGISTPRAGWIRHCLFFAQLRRRSCINEAAQAADNAMDFSKRIRASLPILHMFFSRRPTHGTAECDHQRSQSL